MWQKKCNLQHLQVLTKSTAKMKNNYLHLLVILFFLSGCLQDTTDLQPQMEEKNLTVQEARSLYESTFFGIETKAPSDYEKVNMFYRKDFTPDWKIAFPSRTDDVESVDVPVHEQRHYYVSTQDGIGFYLTHCHHSITVVKSVKTKATGVYHHFFIPFRDSRDKYFDAYEGDLYRGFHNNGFREDFTGLEIYSDSKGRIIKILRYYRGKVYERLYAGDGKEVRQRICWQLKYYILKAYGIKGDTPRTKSPRYLCPQCGAELEIDEYGIYGCPSCPWNEMDFWDQELDELIIYGDGGSGGNVLDPFLDPENPNQPDPNTGEDGGGGGGNGNTTPPDAPTDSIHIPDNIDIPSHLSFIRQALIEIADDCGVSKLLVAISGTNIHFISGNHSFPYYVNSKPNNDGSYNIVCSTDAIQHHTLVEELFHCLQLINGNYSSQWALNVEVEAKYAAFLYAMRNGEFDALPGYTSDKQPFIDYQEDPSETNYLGILEYVRNLSGYGEMRESASHRDMRNLGTMFDCEN